MSSLQYFSAACEQALHLDYSKTILDLLCSQMVRSHKVKDFGICTIRPLENSPRTIHPNVKTPTLLIYKRKRNLDYSSKLVK